MITTSRAITHAETAQADEVIDAVTLRAPDRRLVDPELVRVAIRAWSANTIRAFLSDLRIWDDWCRRVGVPPVAATDATTASFIRALAGVDVVAGVATRAAATIARYLVNIGWAYRMAGLDGPVQGPRVRLELKAARRVLGTRQRQPQGLRFKGDIEDFDSPASGLCITHLLKACRADLLGDRDRALLLVN
ncbi:MAG: integrase, partial [Sphingomonadales bacterium]